MVLTTAPSAGRPTALWVVPVSALGGVARHVLDTVRAGIPGWRLVVLCPPGPLVDDVRAAGGAVTVMPFGPDHGLRASSRSLRRTVDLIRPTVVHSHLSYADIVAAAATPRHVTLVTTEHGIAADDRVYHGTGAKSAVMARVHEARMRRFDAVVAVSEATKRAMLAKWHPRQDVRVIVNGVDPLPEATEPRAGLRILSLARLAPEKRLADLVAAFALVAAERPEASLTLAGTGELEADLRVQVAALGLGDRVVLPGYVDAGGALAAADVLAMLSIWENCPYAVLDGLVHGTGVVAAPVGGIPEMLPDQCLVDPADHAAVAALLDGAGRPGRRPAEGSRRLAHGCRHDGRRRRGLRRGGATGGRTMSVSGWSRSASWDMIPDLPDDGSARSEQRARGTVEFVLFAILPMSRLQFSGLPVGELAMGVAVLYAVLRPGRLRPALGITALLLLALLGLMLYSAELNDLTPYRRLLHMGLYVALAVVASQGRFHVGGMSRGLAFGLVVSAGAYFFGYDSTYEGRLTGLMADPNAAGYLLSTLGCLAMAGMAGSRFRVPAGLLILAAIVLTYSRTSLLATMLIIVWLLIGSRVATFFGSILLGGMIYAVANIPVSLRNFGPFADRTGSDALRNRIVAQENVQIGQGPWYGNGPGTSTVEVQGEPFFFHNSYLALQNEAGKFAVAIVVLAGILALAGLMRLPAAARNYWYEGAIIAVAVCAVNLGEVLLELPAALAVGMALCHARAARQLPATETAAP